MTDVVAFPRDKEKIRQQASEWLAKLESDNLSENDKLAFKQWLNIDKSHRIELMKLANSWDFMKSLARSNVAASSTSSPTKQHSSFYRKTLAIAATVVLSVLSVYFYWHVSTVIEFESSNGTFVTNIGQQQKLTLADGSLLSLNTNSEVVVDFHDGKREIQLLKGEANFDVAHDPKHPFTVKAGNGDVQALGTNFSVRLEGDLVDVLVAQGRVRVRPDETTKAADLTLDKKQKTAGKAAVIAAAGNRVVFEKKSVKSVTKESEKEITRELYWRQGFLAFNDQPLEEVVAELSRYTNHKIVIEDPETGLMKVGGYYPIEDLSTVFTSLELSLGVKVELLADGTYTIKRST